MKILTWHIHGSYLNYLTQAPHTFLLPTGRGKDPGYGGRTPNFRWGDNVVDVPADEVKNLQFDAVLYQHERNWTHDQFDILTPAQRRLPRIYLEHDPPQGHPTDTRHPCNDPDVLIAHCTAFNALMWDNGPNAVRIVDHGVIDPGYLYTGELDRGLVVVNGLKRRGRRLGSDIYDAAAKQVPLDLVGMFSEESGGIGEVPLPDLPAFSARYRFFFHPIRYTSLGLALLEAMMIGLPIVGLATTELPTLIKDGENGFIATDERELVRAMRRLLEDRELARQMGRKARETALARFNIERFADDWSAVFAEVAGQQREAA